GAGIVGLSLAIALNAFDKDKKMVIDLYEAAPELSEVGAGINVWPRTWEMMKSIGLEEALVPLFDHYPDLEPRVVFEIRKADQKDGYKVVDVMKEGGVLRIHRADLQRTLLNNLPLPDPSRTTNSQCALHLSHRVLDYTTSDSGEIILKFADRPSTTCDILVGADGIKSTIRQLFLSRLPNPEEYKKYLHPLWSGTVVYRGLVAKGELAKVFPGHRALDHPGIMYVGKLKHAVVYPIADKLINVVVAVHDKTKDGTMWEGPWNSEVTQRDFYDQFGGWEEEFQALIQCIKRPTKWALQNIKNLDIYGKGRVLIMGDAAHAMVPHQGAGAGIGIEDAYILAAMLTHSSTTRDSLSSGHADKIMKIYNDIRVPRGISMSRASARQGYLYALATPGLKEYKEGDDVPMDKLLEVFREADENWSWTTSDPDDDLRKAVAALVQ
ncbi:FAD/NAD(P)-binding domain-containing protein, partial [Macrolepiota fuliginosa MF-IS2]